MEDSEEGEQALHRSRVPPGLCWPRPFTLQVRAGVGQLLGTSPPPQLLHTLSPGDAAPPPPRLIFPTFPELEVRFPIEMLLKQICKQEFFL